LLEVVLVTGTTLLGGTSGVENLTSGTADLGAGFVLRGPCESSWATLVGGGLLRRDDIGGAAVGHLVVGVSCGTARIVGSKHSRRIRAALLLSSDRVLGDRTDGTARSGRAQVLGVRLRTAKHEFDAIGELVTGVNHIGRGTASISHVLLGRIGDSTRILGHNPTGTISSSGSTRRIIRRTTERTSRIREIDGLLGRAAVGVRSRTERLERAGVATESDNPWAT
jgi:hypothetical protein